MDTLGRLLACIALLGGCSGAPFTGESGTSIDEAGAPAAQGGQPEAGIGGMVQVTRGGASSGGMATTGGQGTAGRAGIAGMAGNSSQGGNASGGTGLNGPNSCLVDYQTAPCAQSCAIAEQTGCGNVIRCFVQHNSDSLDNCPGYSDTAYQLALMAEKECCK